MNRETLARRTALTAAGILILSSQAWMVGTASAVTASGVRPVTVHSYGSSESAAAFPDAPELSPLTLEPLQAGEHSSLLTTDRDAAPFKGRVIAKSGLLVRSGPSQDFKVIGSLKFGQVVGIECKVKGQVIDGNPRWYKLADGKWAWASARFIANIGPAPTWCDK